MAKNSSLVLLGYEDEPISDKQKSFLDFSTNKIGGRPNWPNSDIIIPACPLCSLPRPLIAQIYAPLTNSQFHRTLYIFACVNSICSNQSKSWLCIRTQSMEKQIEKASSSAKKQAKKSSNINWCSGGDEWDDDFGDETFGKISDEINLNEENGNIVRSPPRDNRPASDDEDEEESVSMDSDPIPMFGNLQVIDDKNANAAAGAVGMLNSPSAHAEIEGDESEVVTIDAPMMPERDLIAMLKQTTAIPKEVEHLTLKSFYVAVDEERKSSWKMNSDFDDDHVRELLQDYQRKEENVTNSPSSPGNIVGGAAPSNADAEEKYEKTAPVHGDVMFHNYLERVQENPGQIIRYSRDALPLLIAPLNEFVTKCQNCGGDLLCELQILPTLISKLVFVNGEPCPIEFGNVLIFTCVKSCWDTPDKLRLEHVVVQKEI